MFFRNFLRHFVLYPSDDLQTKFYWDRPLHCRSITLNDLERKKLYAIATQLAHVSWADFLYVYDYANQKKHQKYMWYVQQILYCGDMQKQSDPLGRIFRGRVISSSMSSLCRRGVKMLLQVCVSFLFSPTMGGKYLTQNASAYCTKITFIKKRLNDCDETTLTEAGVTVVAQQTVQEKLEISK